MSKLTLTSYLLWAGNLIDMSELPEPQSQLPNLRLREFLPYLPEFQAKNGVANLEVSSPNKA